MHTCRSVPPPRKTTLLPGKALAVTRWQLVDCPDGLEPPAPFLAWLNQRAHSDHAAPGTLHCLAADLPEGGYRLTASGDQAVLHAGSKAGIAYALLTLRDWQDQHPHPAPALLVEDWPDFPVRGILLDISRNKIPTLPMLKQWIDLFAQSRINHLQFYTEHTFAYRGHEAIWQDATPLTPDEMRELDTYCAERLIELTPNQNSFGHLQKWLQHPRYAHLANAPDGYTTPWGEFRPRPFSLNPLHPGSLDLLADWYQQLLPTLRSKRFNVGCDETFDLGQGASREACERAGKGRVYLDYLLKVHALVSQHDHHMLFWGDIILHHPELIPELPAEITALVWGYEANHPFQEQCRHFQNAGVPFWVCPGTSTWNSLTGRWSNARANIRSAARHGKAEGAGGILITEWGDNGHWQTLPFSAAALRMGAAYAWNREAADRCPDQAFFAGLIPDADPQPLVELANAWEWFTVRIENLSPLFSLVVRDDLTSLLVEVSPSELEHALTQLETIARHIPSDPEVHLPMRLMQFACHRGLFIQSGKQAQAEASRTLLEEIHPLFLQSWQLRNRPGGLAESRQALDRRRAEFT